MPIQPSLCSSSCVAAAAAAAGHRLWQLNRPGALATLWNVSSSPGGSLAGTVPLPLPNTTFNLTQVAFEPTVYVYSHPRFAWWVEPGARRVPGDLYAAQLALRTRGSYNPLAAFVYGQLLEDPESGLGERDVAALIAQDANGGGAAAGDGTGGCRVGCSGGWRVCELGPHRSWLTQHQ
jgi:hypothetical protein